MVIMKQSVQKSVVTTLLINIICVTLLTSCGNPNGDIGKDSGVDESTEAFSLAVLSGPEYEGRGAHTEGNRLAAELLAERLEFFGLEPLNGRTGYLMPFEQKVRIPGETVLKAVFSDGSFIELEYGKDYMFSGSSAMIDETVPVAKDLESLTASSILFLDRFKDEPPPYGTFATLAYISDDLYFSSLGVVNYGDSAGYPRVIILRPAYNMISEAVELELKYTFEDANVTLNSAVGVLPGNDRTKAVLLSAHFDGMGDQIGNRLPGALDNASGVIVLDMAMQRIAGTEMPYDVIIAFTNSEECGFTGAVELSGRLYGRYEEIYNINVDCVGLPGVPFSMYGSEGISTELRAQMGGYLSRYGFACDYDDYIAGDHVVFESLDIPSVVLANTDRHTYHTALDVPENVDENILEKIAGMIVDFILENPDIHATLGCCDDHDHDDDIGVNPEEMPSLAYNEALLQNDTLYMGSSKWITYDDAVKYHPGIPLPQTFRGCTIQACIVMLTVPVNAEPDQLIELPSSASDIQKIIALYSDGGTAYRIVFCTLPVVDSIMRTDVAGGYLMTDTGSATFSGVGLRRGNYSLEAYDGDSAFEFEIEPGITVDMLRSGTSKVTEENAPAMLVDPELTGLFEELQMFIQS